MDFSELDFKFQEIADPKTVTLLSKIGQALAKIYSAIPKTVVLPKIFPISGKVEVVKTPPVVITNLNEIGPYFQSLEQKLTVWAQAASTAKPPEITFPKFDFPKNETTVDMSGVISAVQSLEKALQGREKSSDTAILRRMSDTLSEYASRPTMTTPPVTNINLNALEGVTKTTSATVGTGLTTLPTYGQLPARRTLIIYNNSANTIYLGGSDVTINNGLPLPTSSYSPPIDAGYNMIVYGIAATSGNNVRIMEVSKDVSSNIQE